MKQRAEFCQGLKITHQEHTKAEKFINNIAALFRAFIHTRKMNKLRHNSSSPSEYFPTRGR